MPEFTLKIRRYDHKERPPYWDTHTVDLSPVQSVLDAILKIKDDEDGSIGIRCSCQQAICGSCGVRINGKPGLACNTHLREAAQRGHGTGWNPPDEGQESPVITVEPMGNMPVIRDLIVDMDAVHWKKIRRVAPRLHRQGAGARARVHREQGEHGRRDPADGLHPVRRVRVGLPVDGGRSAVRRAGGARQGLPVRRRPARCPAPRGLSDLSEDPHGMYDCTHCFSCIDACPKGVAPMSQIMRLRRIAGSDFEIKDRNNGYNHEHAFVKNIRKNGILHEPDLLADSYGGKLNPAAGKELLGGLPTALKGLSRGKMTPRTALGHATQGPARGQEAVRHDRRKAQALRAQSVRERIRERGRDRGRRGNGVGVRGAGMKVAVLARLREPRVHPGAPRIHGARSRRCSISS